MDDVIKGLRDGALRVVPVADQISRDNGDSYERAPDHTAELLQALENDRRYRWLRSQNWNDGELCVVSYPKDSVKLGCDCPSLDRLDAAIDAAIAASEGVQGGE